jgi:hypothetical protein
MLFWAVVPVVWASSAIKYVADGSLDLSPLRAAGAAASSGLWNTALTMAISLMQFDQARCLSSVR